MAAKKGAWVLKPTKKTEPRTARLVDVKALLIGDEIRLSSKGIVGRVTAIGSHPEGRREITADGLGSRILHEDHQVIRLDPKPATQADQRKPR